MRKVVFLDRDGVINKERGDYTWQLEHWKFTEDIFEFCRRVSDIGFDLIVVTNQGGIAKGLYTQEDVQSLHAMMLAEFAKKGVKILDVFLSPYHDMVSRSLSRKPDSLMLEKAIYLYDIDPARSFMIGDSERDILASNKVGVKGIKIRANTPLLPLLQEIE